MTLLTPRVASIATPYVWVDISTQNTENRLQKIKSERQVHKSWTEEASKLMQCPSLLHKYDKAEHLINTIMGVDVEAVKVLLNPFKIFCYGCLGVKSLRHANNLNDFVDHVMNAHSNDAFGQRFICNWDTYKETGW